MAPPGERRLGDVAISVFITFAFFISIFPLMDSYGISDDRKDIMSEDGVRTYSYDDFLAVKGDGHTHTNHSSGTTTVAENVAKAKQQGLDWLAITDHKTVAAKAECESETSGSFICVLGEEVSTSGGHVLAWGIDRYVDWTLGPTRTMSDIFEEVHVQGGLAVVAHPFAPDPDDYDFWGVHEGFDAIEVYHGYAGFNDFPISTDMDGQALSKWEDFLNLGLRKTAVGDSDCHNASNTPDGGDLTNRRGAIGYPRNVVYVKEFTQRGILEGVRSGRLYVTDGPELNFTVNDMIMGETLYEAGPSTLTINISGYAPESSDLNVMRNGTQIFSQVVGPGTFSHSFTDSPAGDSWYRAEVRNPTLINGEINVAFANPIFLDVAPFEEPPEPPANLTAELVGSNVVLSWDPSPSPDVEFYGIFKSTTIDGFEFDFPVAYTTNNSWVDTDRGIGDNDTYFYVVRAIDKTRLNDSNTEKAVKLVMPFDPGTQLVSIPIITSNETLGSVLKALQYDIVWVYNNTDIFDPWKSHNPSKTLNDLTSDSKINSTRGFWVHVTAESSITVAGRIPISTSILLKEGWNLVGYPSFTERTVSDALSGIPYERVEGYEATSPQRLRLMTDTDLMKPTFGYWIKASSDAILTIGN
jgi:hypothetical protein